MEKLLVYDPLPAAKLLYDARVPGQSLTGLPNTVAPVNLDQAYRIQAALCEILTSTRGPVQGYKVGCTNASARTLLGINSCFSGRCFERDIKHTPTMIAHTDYHMVGIEPEIAIRVGQDLLPTNSWTPDSVAELSIEVMPSIELVESRFSTWPEMGAFLAVADNGVHRELILGEPISDWSMESVNRTEVSLWANNERVEQGHATNVDGGPFGVLAWLANHLNTQGDALRAGEIVTTGVLTNIYNAKVGQRLVANYGPFGNLEIEIK